MYIVLGLFVVSILFFVSGAIASRNLRVREFVISNDNTKGIKGFKIVLLSDLHGRYLGKNQEKLVDEIIKHKPDLLVMNGDMVDAYDKDAKAVGKLAQMLSGKVEMIAVRGNHFYKACKNVQEDMENVFSEFGVISLKNQRKCISYKEVKICIDGLDDPRATVAYENGDRKRDMLRKNRIVVKSSLDKMLNENEHSDYKILIIHRPTDVDLFEREGYDLTLSGHTHGGQWALPFGIEILGDEVTFFPPKNMQSGLHYHNKMPLIITSGIGYSNVHLRTFMPPEIVVITFK